MPLFNINRHKVVQGAIDLLEELKTPDRIEDIIANSISKEVMRDEDVYFIVRSFKMKYGLGEWEVEVLPKVKAGSLTISSWVFMVNGKPLFTGTGLDTLLTKVSEAIITTDKVSIDTVVRQLKTCIQ